MSDAFGGPQQDYYNQLRQEKSLLRKGFREAKRSGNIAAAIAYQNKAKQAGFGSLTSATRVGGLRKRAEMMAQADAAFGLTQHNSGIDYLKQNKRPAGGGNADNPFLDQTPKEAAKSNLDYLEGKGLSSPAAKPDPADQKAQSRLDYLDGKGLSKDEVDMGPENPFETDGEKEARHQKLKNEKSDSQFKGLAAFDEMQTKKPEAKADTRGLEVLPATGKSLRVPTGQKADTSEPQSGAVVDGVARDDSGYEFGFRHEGKLTPEEEAVRKDNWDRQLEKQGMKEYDIGRAKRLLEGSYAREEAEDPEMNRFIQDVNERQFGYERTGDGGGLDQQEPDGKLYADELGTLGLEGKVMPQGEWDAFYGGLKGDVDRAKRAPQVMSLINEGYLKPEGGFADGVSDDMKRRIVGSYRPEEINMEGPIGDVVRKNLKAADDMVLPESEQTKMLKEATARRKEGEAAIRKELGIPDDLKGASVKQLEDYNERSLGLAKSNQEWWDQYRKDRGDAMEEVGEDPLVFAGDTDKDYNPFDSQVNRAQTRIGLDTLEMATPAVLKFARAPVGTSVRGTVTELTDWAGLPASESFRKPAEDYMKKKQQAQKELEAAIDKAKPRNAAEAMLAINQSKRLRALWDDYGVEFENPEDIGTHYKMKRSEIFKEAEQPDNPYQTHNYADRIAAGVGALVAKVAGGNFSDTYKDLTSEGNTLTDREAARLSKEGVFGTKK